MSLPANFEPSADHRGAPARYEIVAIGASAGGLHALGTLLSALPATFAAPILVSVHLSPDHPSAMAELLNRRTPLRVADAQHRDPLEAGTVYVAPPDYHLCVDPTRRIRLTHTERVRFARPSLDEMFRSVARVYGSRAIGVVCTGGGSDGADGLLELRERGGMTLAQDRSTSQYFTMPREAIRRGGVCEVLPIGEIPRRLIELVGCRPADGADHEERS